MAGVDVQYNDRLGKLKISDEGIKESYIPIVTRKFFFKNPEPHIDDPDLGGGYNKDCNKLDRITFILTEILC